MDIFRSFKLINNRYYCMEKPDLTQKINPLPDGLQAEIEATNKQVEAELGNSQSEISAEERYRLILERTKPKRSKKG